MYSASTLRINIKKKRHYIFYTSTKNPNKNAQGFFYVINSYDSNHINFLHIFHLPVIRIQNLNGKKKVFANWFYLFRYSKKYFSSLNQTFHALAFVNSKQEEKSIHVNNAVHAYIHEHRVPGTVSYINIVLHHNLRVCNKTSVCSKTYLDV